MDGAWEGLTMVQVSVPYRSTDVTSAEKHRDGFPDGELAQEADGNAGKCLPGFSNAVLGFVRLVRECGNKRWWCATACPMDAM